MKTLQEYVNEQLITESVKQSLKDKFNKLFSSFFKKINDNLSNCKELNNFYNTAKDNDKIKNAKSFKDVYNAVKSIVSDNKIKAINSEINATCKNVKTPEFDKHEEEVIISKSKITESVNENKLTDWFTKLCDKSDFVSGIAMVVGMLAGTIGLIFPAFSYVGIHRYAEDKNPMWLVLSLLVCAWGIATYVHIFKHSDDPDDICLAVEAGS